MTATSKLGHEGTPEHLTDANESAKHMNTHSEQLKGATLGMDKKARSRSTHSFKTEGVLEVKHGADLKR